MKTASTPQARFGQSHLTRRASLQALTALVALGFGSFSVGSAGCSADASGPKAPALPREPDGDAPETGIFTDNVDALFDVLVPAEHDESGAVTRSGAREVFADQVLGIENFVGLAIAQGFLPMAAESVAGSLTGLATGFRSAMNQQLDAFALVEKPLTPFRDLSRNAKERIVVRAFADKITAPGFQILRAAALTGFLGAVHSDAGLVQLGFPPFENFADGLAVSGYPRTRSGRRVDAAKEDLAKLAAAHELDDYTYNRPPAATPGGELSGVLDANGDLL